MFQRPIRYLFPAAVLVLASGAASFAAPARSQPEPKTYSLTYNYQLKVNGTTVKEIIRVYRDGDRAMSDITVLPNAKNPKTVRSFSVKNLRTHKTWDWGPGVEECTTGSFSGDSWSGDPFVAFPMGFRFPSELSSPNAKIPPGMVRLIGTGTALGFKTKVYALAIPGQPKSKIWVEEQYGLILKSAHLSKDGHYQVDRDAGITRFSTAKPPASVFALGGPCAGASTSGAGSAGVSATGGSSGIALPGGADIEVKWNDGSALKLKPAEQVAFLLVQDINHLQTFACQMYLKRYCSLAEMVRGVKTAQGVQGLTVDPARDKNYRFAVGISGKEYAISARPTRPGIGGWLFIQHEFESDCYFNPGGPATGKSKQIGESSFGTDFLRH